MQRPLRSLGDRESTEILGIQVLYSHGTRPVWSCRAGTDGQATTPPCPRWAVEGRMIGANKFSSTTFLTLQTRYLYSISCRTAGRRSRPLVALLVGIDDLRPDWCISDIDCMYSTSFPRDIVQQCSTNDYWKSTTSSMEPFERGVGRDSRPNDAHGCQRGAARVSLISGSG